MNLVSWHLPSCSMVELNSQMYWLSNACTHNLWTVNFRVYVNKGIIHELQIKGLTVKMQIGRASGCQANSFWTNRTWYVASHSYVRSQNETTKLCLNSLTQRLLLNKEHKSSENIYMYIFIYIAMYIHMYIYCPPKAPWKTSASVDTWEGPIKRPRLSVIANQIASFEKLRQVGWLKKESVGFDDRSYRNHLMS